MSWQDPINNNYISMLEGYAQNYMNPNSQYNRGQYNNFKQMGVDNAGQTYNQGLRMQAMGQNPFATQQYREALSNATGQAQDAYMQQNQQSQSLGAGMLGMANQTRQQLAQQMQQQAQMDREYRQHKRGQWLGLLGTLGSAAITGPLGGIMGKGLLGLAGKFGNLFRRTSSPGWRGFEYTGDAPEISQCMFPSPFGPDYKLGDD